MSATEQRTGFRLPWSSDGRSSAAVDAPPAQDAEVEPTENSVTTAQAVADRLAWPAADSRSKGVWATGAAAKDTVAASTASATGPTPGPMPTDLQPSAAPSPSPTPSRRDNPLVAGLVRAMREAAAGARAEAAARVAGDAETVIASLRTASAGTTTSLKRQAEEDVTAIREWSKAELARIREEADQRTHDRRARLERDLAGSAAGLDGRVNAVHVALEDFEHRMASFFEQLMAEEDPARLAGLAERLPDAPTFDDLDDWVARADTLDPADAAAAEAAAFVDLGSTDETAFAGTPDGPAPDVVEDPAPEPDPAAEAIAPDIEQAAPEAAAPEPPPVPVETPLVVVGLVSVASIAAFKRAVGRLAGVSGVSVSSGPDGDFVFTVNHVAGTDLATEVAALDTYHPVVTTRTDGAIAVTVTEPDTDA